MPRDTPWLFKMQLSFLSEQVSNTSFDKSKAYQIVLENNRPDWRQMLRAVSAIETTLGKISYDGFKSSEDFFDTLPNANYYINATKAVWWQRLVFTDRPLGYLSYEDLKLNPFLRIFSIGTFGKKSKRFKVSKTQVPIAKYHYEQVKERTTTKPSTKALGNYAQEYRNLKINKEIELLQGKLAKLHWELHDARQRVFSYYGHQSSNLEINPKYIELFALAKQLQLTTIQHSVFTDILMFQGFYPACRYLDKFGLDEYLAKEEQD